MAGGELEGDGQREFSGAAGFERNALLDPDIDGGADVRQSDGAAAGANRLQLSAGDFFVVQRRHHDASDAGGGGDGSGPLFSLLLSPELQRSLQLTFVQQDVVVVDPDQQRHIQRPSIALKNASMPSRYSAGISSPVFPVVC